MRLKPYLIIIYTLIFLSQVKAEGQSKDVSSILLNLYDRVLFTISDEEKLRLNDSILLIIDSYAASDSVFTHRFAHLRFLGQAISSDSKVKIITWNLVLRDGTNNYFCYLIHKRRKGEKNHIYKLKGKHLDEPAETDKLYYRSDWYGALYYAIQPCRKDYILLGFDFSELMTSRKIIEVLSFTPEGEIVFGKNLFLRENETKFREVIEYSWESVVTLRFNSAKLIVFDHLASFSTSDEENSESYGAGLSFDGYLYKKGFWRFTTGVDARNPKK
jgi:hypothetical protein